MHYEPIQNAVDALLEEEIKARNITETIAANASRLASLLIPHVRSLSGYRAMELKAALRDLDGRTGRWKRRA